VADELRIIVKKSEELPDLPRLALEKALAEYGDRLMQNAEIIEKTRRATPGRPMITDTAIALADLNARNGQFKRAPSTKFKVMSIIEYAATFGAGAFAGYISKPFGAAGFAVCAVLAILMHSTKKDGNE
jgi:hypothetical protein